MAIAVRVRVPPSAPYFKSRYKQQPVTTYFLCSVQHRHRTKNRTWWVMEAKRGVKDTTKLAAALFAVSGENPMSPLTPARLAAKHPVASGNLGDDKKMLQRIFGAKEVFTIFAMRCPRIPSALWAVTNCVSACGHPTSGRRMARAQRDGSSRTFGQIFVHYRRQTHSRHYP